jgi:hypothetical protein
VGYRVRSAVVEVWDHGGRLYEINSYYSLPADAWHYELVGLTGSRETGPFLRRRRRASSPLSPPPTP